MSTLTRIETFIQSPTTGQQVNFNFDLDLAQKFDDYLHKHYQQGICYETEVADVMLRVLREGDLAIDVGANNGFFTVFMSKLVGQSGMVLAIEPLEENIGRLEHAIEINDCLNVEVIPRPASRTVEDVTFWVSSDDTSSSCLWDPGNWWQNEKSRQNPRSVMLRATTIDSMVGLNATPALIKIDTEGAEFAVLEGAARVLRRKVPYIVCEMNPFGLVQMGATDEQLRSFMYDRGYEMFVLHPTGALPTLFPQGVKLRYLHDVTVRNVLFSTIANVAKAWPEALE